MSGPPRERAAVARPIAVLTVSSNPELTAAWCAAMDGAGTFGRTESVPDVETGVALLRQSRFADVVLLDRRLPGLEPEAVGRIAAAAPAAGVVVHAGRSSSTASGSSDAVTLIREISDGVTCKPDSLLFPGTPTPELARRFVAEACQRWAMWAIVDSAQLVATELIANAARHGEPPISLHVTRTAAGVRIDVRDGSPTPPRLPDTTPLSDAGRGLVLVGAFAIAWGVQRVMRGKSVWAVLSAGESPPTDVYPAGTPVEMMRRTGEWDPGYFVIHGDDLGYILGRSDQPGEKTPPVASLRVRVPYGTSTVRS